MQLTRWLTAQSCHTAHQQKYETRRPGLTAYQENKQGVVCSHHVQLTASLQLVHHAVAKAPILALWLPCKVQRTIPSKRSLPKPQVNNTKMLVTISPQSCPSSRQMHTPALTPMATWLSPCGYKMSLGERYHYSVVVKHNIQTKNELTKQISILHFRHSNQRTHM